MKTTRIKNVLIATCLFLLSNQIFAQFPTDFQRVQLASGLASPTVMLHLADGRILIGEQNGVIKVFKNGVVLPTPLATLPTLKNGERGLGGLVLSPTFSIDGYLYVYYTEADGTNNVIDRYKIVGDVGTNVTRILTLDNTVNTNHNGGAMVFKDGLMYVSVGESNVSSNATNLDTYHGKILRLNPNGTPAAGNPYYGTGSVQRQSIWAVGFRNPWTMSLDPITKRIFVNDVGGNYEEVNDVTAPDATKNYDYGWNTAQLSGPEQEATKIRSVYNYGHSNGRCAITNGIFFNPTNTNWPATYKNKYYYNDWCTTAIWYINPDNPAAGPTVFASSGATQATGLSVGIDGDLYYFDWGTGVMYKVRYTNTQAPQITQNPIGDHYLSNNNTRTATIPAGQNITLSVEASGAAPLQYQWLKNGVDIPNQKNKTLVLNNLNDPLNDGKYSVRVSNGAGNVTSLEFTLNVVPFSTKPVATITSPASSKQFSGGETISFSGTATDVEDGNVEAANIKWEIQFHHADTEETAHWHPGQAVNQGSLSGIFTTLTNGENSPNVWYRIVMYVEDESGLRDTAFVEIQPKLSNLTALTEPAGLLVNLNGQSVSPRTIQAVQNVDAFLEAVSPQVIGTTKYEFSHWKHGGVISQIIPTPATATSYTAVYTASKITNVDVTAIQDAYVRGGANENTAFGATTPTVIETKVTGTLDFVREAYFTFDLKNYSVIDEAILKVYCSEAAPNTNVDIYAVRDVVWNENTVTWLTKPIRDNIPLASVLVDAAGKYHSWNLSNYIKAEKAAGRNTVSFAMVNPIETGPQVKWNSKETGTNPPLLSVKLTDTITSIENEHIADFGFYPNPVSDRLYLGQETEWQLLDLSGKTALRGQGSVVECASLHTGIYILKTNKLYVKIIKQ